ncbi:MAG: hypothetical protein KY476_19680 [Planctomycetes bacterium]|nr:hypothetical protein [Planctomycetota bacterium]
MAGTGRAALFHPPSSILHPLFPALLAALVPVLLAGCSGLGWKPWSRETIPTADAKNPVQRVVCIWEASEGRGVDGLPARGFAGQILFFTRTNSAPVRVEGDVRVYVFDDQGTPEEQKRPIHQYDFLHGEDADSWNRHLAVGALGPAYYVFIPYPRKGGHQARCALQVRLVPREGQPAFSDMISVVLPGYEGGNSSPAQRDRLETVSGSLMELSGRQSPAAANSLLSRPRGETVGTVSRFQQYGPARIRPVETVVQAAAVEPQYDQPQDVQPAVNHAAVSPEAARMERLERMLEGLMAERADRHPGHEPPQMSAARQPTRIDTTHVLPSEDAFQESRGPTSRGELRAAPASGNFPHTRPLETEGYPAARRIAGPETDSQSSWNLEAATRRHPLE